MGFAQGLKKICSKPLNSGHLTLVVKVAAIRGLTVYMCVYVYTHSLSNALHQPFKVLQLKEILFYQSRIYRWTKI